MTAYRDLYILSCVVRRPDEPPLRAQVAASVPRGEAIDPQHRREMESRLVQQLRRDNLIFGVAIGPLRGETIPLHPDAQEPDRAVVIGPV
jgi:hypothetical protein